MKRTEIQKAIIPRNWLFGRLKGICNHLRTITQSSHLTPNEYTKLTEAWGIIMSVVDNKKKSSEEIKTFIKIKKSWE